jgi:hypothetical protein
MPKHWSSPPTPEEEQEAENRRWPWYFLAQLSQRGRNKLHDRLCYFFARHLGRPGAWVFGRCVDEYVNEAVQHIYEELAKGEVALEMAPYPAVGRMATSSDWEELAIGALVKYSQAPSMVGAAKRAAWRNLGTAAPRDWTVEDRGQLPLVHGLKDIDTDSMALAQQHARRAQEEADENARRGQADAQPVDETKPKKVGKLLFIYRPDEEQFGELHQASTAGETVTPEDELAAKQAAVREAAENPLRLPFLRKRFSGKPRILEFIAAAVAEARDPAGRLYKSGGKSDSIDHLRMLELLGPTWTIQEVRSVWATLTAPRRDPGLKQEIGEGFAALVNTTAPQQRPAPSSDSSEAEAADEVTRISKLRVKR